MKNRFIKILIILMSLSTLLVFSNKFIENIKADSGFDTDYDSGGWDSSSSWDNDFDSDYDSNYDRDYSSGGGTFHGFTFLIIMFIFIVFVRLLISSKSSKSYHVQTIEKYNELIM